ncbi:MAG: hypothetical protein RL381_961 [Actinomycetota bacterium]
MSSAQLPHDPLWPRAASLFTSADTLNSDISLVGVPASATSISPTDSHKTPGAIRDALQRYSLAHSHPRANLKDLVLCDAGNVISPDSDEESSISELERIRKSTQLLIALGGDNSITYSGFKASGCTGLITFDAHYDLRDGISNGSPVRRLIESGLSGTKVVQIGIADFSNSPEYAQRAKDFGITVIPRSDFRTRSIEDICNEALAVAGDNVYVDFDMDVCDRSVVPGCPAAAPGGISADEIRQLAFVMGSSKQVKACDITEIDSERDSKDERSIRLAALVILEFAAGYSTRI